jgi:N-methylhydantoinase A
MPFPVDPAIMQRHFDELETEVRRRLDDQDLSYREVRLNREVDVRYTMQMFEVPTPVPAGNVDGSIVHGVVEAFEDRYAALYGKGTGFREAGVQAITYRVYGVGQLPFKPDLPHAAVADRPTPPVQESRRALLDLRDGWQQVDIYNYRVLGSGHSFRGPAIVEAPTTAVVIPQGVTATVDRLGNLVLNYV